MKNWLEKVQIWKHWIRVDVALLTASITVQQNRLSALEGLFKLKQTWTV